MATSFRPAAPQHRAPQLRPYEAPLSTFTVMALAFGLGVLGYYMLDGHAHICEVCNNKWRHLGAFNLGDPAAHTCKKCGTVQWVKDGVPHAFGDVFRMTSPMPRTPVAAAPAFGAPRPQLAFGAPSHEQGVLR